MSSNWYGEDGTNGTCGVTNGSPNVTFSAANLLTNNAATQGDGFKGPDGVNYGIFSVTGDNAITLNKNYGGATNAAGAWAIIPLLGGRSVALTKLVSTLLNSGSYSSLAAVTPAVGDFLQCTGTAPIVWSNRTSAQVLVSLLGAASEANVASAANCDIGAQASVKLSITGSIGITSFNPAAGAVTQNAVRLVRFTGTPILTASATLILPGLANGQTLTAAAGDTAIFASDNSATPVWRCWQYMRAGVTPGGTITSTSANALTVGPNGTTNPTFNVDASTPIAATGLNVKGAAASGGVAVSVLSSGANESLGIDAKGTGSITLGANSTGNIVLARSTTVNGTLGLAGSAATSTNAIQLSGTTTARNCMSMSNTGAAATLGISNSAGSGLFTGDSAYATVLGTQNATPLQFGTNGIINHTITSGAMSVTQNASGFGLGMVPSNILDITQNSNSIARPTISNPSNGGSATAVWLASNGAQNAQFGMLGTGYTTSGVLVAGDMYLYSDGNIAIRSAGSVKFAVNASPTQVVGIGTDGSLLAGTTVNGGVFGNSKMAVQQNAAGQAFSVYQQSSSGNAVALRVDSSGSTFIGLQVGTTAVGSITSNGSTTTYGTTSARALKMGAQALDVSAMFDGPSVMYRGQWITQPDIDWVGGIADEMAKLVPEGYLPSTTPDLAPHQEGYIPDQFDYTKWVPYLVAEAFRARAAEKAAQQQVAALTTALTTIQARLTAAGIA